VLHDQARFSIGIGTTRLTLLNSIVSRDVAE
jgi:hypothetical protein